ncbi:hypothetical protein PHYSODRAFT_490447 [Phytophthora sojae]|uniref:Uncharacterized protein n=1 Tax=Phytophthora sojae (strain P6497) TaxID=1094619 RepID=G4Z2P2_PHYSP|nr:hypothetical protein PHYSODRAFT_490447 [Phytophthora sojae]EGZ21471.1 hypothetical protein PHYSODRAFT_490447 [Phytophthora sojae]|eukprot:XP_009524188.1 hypothetical protein PHYSODRAFT_490447 [Phytophthora sojae]
MLLTLVLWIEAQLEKYRVAVVADIDHATSTRQLISANFSGYRKTPDDTHPSLPQQDGKDVCLKFLSKRGCPSKDPSVCIVQSRVHFYPAAISDQLRNFIRHRFGGVNNKYTNN